MARRNCGGNDMSLTLTLENLRMVVREELERHDRELAAKRARLLAGAIEERERRFAPLDEATLAWVEGELEKGNGRESAPLERVREQAAKLPW